MDEAETLKETSGEAAPETNIKPIVEALLFASYDPLSVQRIKTILHNDIDVSIPDIKKVILQLKEDYDVSGRGFEIVELGGGFHMRTKKNYAKWLEILLHKKKKESFSQAALETLSIIAYRQPVSKAEIENIRGVNVDGVVQKLLEKELIMIFKKKEGPTLPYQYVTTNKFLEHFGLTSLADMPKLDHYSNLG
jgi:segregation and condensation protein B